MDDTPNLHLPYLLAAQAQKHVTHNEALRALDAIVHLAVLDAGLATPPASPVEAARYIVATGATGVWSGQAGKIAAWQDGAWSFHTPRAGWLCWITGANRSVVYDGTGWIPLPVSPGAAPVSLNLSAHGATNVHSIVEQELVLSGASVDSTVLIPDRAIVLCVSTRTTQAVTGATSYGCGIASDPVKYGNLLGVAVGSANSGVTAPTAFYAATPVRITANGGNFTALR